VILFEGDTVVAITPDQLSQVNVMERQFAECEELRIKNDSIITTYKLHDEACTSENKVLIEIISTKDLIVSEKDIQNQILAEALAEEKKTTKKLKRRVKIFTFVGTAVGIGGGILVGSLIK
jgi:hypothetical protein